MHCRIAELNRKRELNAAAELKKMEIALAKRYTHQAALHRFLCTAAKPALLWMPAKHCADTILLEEQRQLDLRVWMVGLGFCPCQHLSQPSSKSASPYYKCRRGQAN